MREKNEALARMSSSPDAARKRKPTDLARARTELENIQSGHLPRSPTPSVGEMLKRGVTW